MKGTISKLQLGLMTSRQRTSSTFLPQEAIPDAVHHYSHAMPAPYHQTLKEFATNMTRGRCSRALHHVHVWLYWLLLCRAFYITTSQFVRKMQTKGATLEPHPPSLQQSLAKYAGASINKSRAADDTAVEDVTSWAGSARCALADAPQTDEASISPSGLSMCVYNGDDGQFLKTSSS